MRIYPRDLILVIGGGLKAGESRKGYLRRVSEITGIGYRSIEEAWWGRYHSKNTEKTLQTAAQEKAKHDDDELIAKIESHATHLETVDADFHRADIDAARAFLASYRGYAATRLFADVPPGNDDDSEGK